MIERREVNKKGFKESEEVKANLDKLCEKLNEVRKLYGKPMSITSGLRSMDDHLRIYAEKGITDKKKIPMTSKHLFGNAADIADPSGDLWMWCLAHVEELEEIGIWLEDRQGGWVHMQIIPFNSYKPGGTIVFKV